MNDPTVPRRRMRWWMPAIILILAGIVAGGLYVAHARRRKDPILDLSLMRIPTFRLSVIAGSLTRITQGALPFLLPLMLQVVALMVPVMLMVPSAAAAAWVMTRAAAARNTEERSLCFI